MCTSLTLSADFKLEFSPWETLFESWELKSEAEHVIMRGLGSLTEIRNLNLVPRQESEALKLPSPARPLSGSMVAAKLTEQTPGKGSRDRKETLVRLPRSKGS